MNGAWSTQALSGSDYARVLLIYYRIWMMRRGLGKGNFFMLFSTLQILDRNINLDVPTPQENEKLKDETVKNYKRTLKIAAD